LNGGEEKENCTYLRRFPTVVEACHNGCIWQHNV